MKVWASINSRSHLPSCSVPSWARSAPPPRTSASPSDPAHVITSTPLHPPSSNSPGSLAKHFASDVGDGVFSAFFPAAPHPSVSSNARPLTSRQLLLQRPCVFPVSAHRLPLRLARFAGHPLAGSRTMCCVSASLTPFNRHPPANSLRTPGRASRSSPQLTPRRRAQQHA